MPRALAEAAASSTAHGIGKAAGANSTFLRVMWILLFLACLVLFLNNGFNLVMKLKNRVLIHETQADKVPFVFPDLYFCPSNPYSGSYPFVLTKQEANLINSEISRILRQLDELFSAAHAEDMNAAGVDIFARTQLEFAQASLPFHLIAEYLVQRVPQSVLHVALLGKSENDWLKPFYLPGSLVCFKLDLSPEYKSSLHLANSTLEIWLSTDPYFSELNFTGYPINPINDAYGSSLLFQNWHPIHNVEELKQSGYTMLIVPQGAYPSLEFESDFHLGPGNAYSVKLEMVENKFSDELHGTHCIANHPKVGFENPLTRERELFNYSKAVCYWQRRILSNDTGCRISEYPMLWEHQGMPRCFNVSEMANDTFDKLLSEGVSSGGIDSVAKTDDYCMKRIPCTYPHYSASFSFGKWPSGSRSTAEFFAKRYYNEAEAPGLAKLATIARQMESGNHSAHQEGIFRTYVSESMLKVRISAACSMSSQAVLTWSYTVTDFLADTGGLLGLYIGCSLLTLCELLELLYILVETAFKRKLHSGDTEAEGVGYVIRK